MTKSATASKKPRNQHTPEFRLEALKYGAPRLADELPVYNIKTIAFSLRRQGLRTKAARKFSPVSL